MKTKRGIKAFLCLFAAMFFLPSVSYCGWELYDDFSSATIDGQRWQLSGDSAIVSIDNGKVKFQHLPGNPGEFTRLKMVDRPEQIAGVKVTILVQSCSGDVRSRLAGFAGKTNENYVYSNIQAEAVKEKISCYATVETPPPSQNMLYLLLWNEFTNPTNIIGSEIIVQMVFCEDKIVYSAQGQGDVEYLFDNMIFPTDNYFKAIGTKSDNGEGPCIVYFDDIYVLRNNE